MKLDQKKLARQTKCFEAVLGFYANPVAVLISGVSQTVKAGIIEAATGFGKTFIAVMAIKRQNTKYPDRTAIVIVPTTKLKNDWTREKQVLNEEGEVVLDYGHIIKHGLQNVRVFVVNTYVKYVNYECDLLILDEAHHYAGVDADHFNKVIAITKFKYGLGLSATLSEPQKAFFASLGWRIADTVSPEECEREGYTSRSITYNLAIPLTEEDEKFNDEINNAFKTMFKKFNHEFELLRACNIGESVSLTVKLNNGTFLGKRTGKEWRLFLAKRWGWDGTASHPYSPANLAKYAALGMYYMRKRKDRWQNMPSKLKYVREIVNKFSNMKMLIFSETGDFADKIAALFPETCLAYHTKLDTLAIRGDSVVTNPNKDQTKILRKEGYKIKGKATRKKEALEAFVDPNSKINQISAVRALDEGVDVPKVEVILQTAYSSTSRQNTQREGRGKRIDYDNLGKKAILINLYMAGTQEEKWLKSKQIGKRMIRWVESVDEILPNKTVSLYVEEPEEASGIEAGNVSSDNK